MLSSKIEVYLLLKSQKLKKQKIAGTFDISVEVHRTF
jgi:hypothetical protein